MSEDKNSVPFIAFEGEMTRMERIIKRLWIALLVVIVLFVASNAAWVYYETQFEDIVVTQENADGINNYIGNDGVINNGETND